MTSVALIRNWCRYSGDRTRSDLAVCVLRSLCQVRAAPQNRSAILADQLALDLFQIRRPAHIADFSRDHCTASQLSALLQRSFAEFASPRSQFLAGDNSANQRRPSRSSQKIPARQVELSRLEELSAFIRPIRGFFRVTPSSVWPVAADLRTFEIL